MFYGHYSSGQYNRAKDQKICTIFSFFSITPTLDGGAGVSLRPELLTKRCSWRGAFFCSMLKYYVVVGFGVKRDCFLSWKNSQEKKEQKTHGYTYSQPSLLGQVLLQICASAARITNQSASDLSIHYFRQLRPGQSVDPLAILLGSEFLAVRILNMNLIFPYNFQLTITELM